MATGKTRDRDFLLRLEAYLNNALKISRYATKIILSSSLLPKTLTLHHRLRSFESNDVNAFRVSHLDSRQDPILSPIAYGGEGTYYAEFFGYSGSVNMKIRDLRRLREDEMHVNPTIKITTSRGLIENFFFFRSKN
ncbi:hypothetical protein EUGRSUZ_E00144 [Eucalyptus grandis]|uniref:Uncharacterized protein n=2 Tax=Eucalyptus grandis TaxID=71139 RepID=A0ACC3KQE7_EUCGR|nr:hypothetical protein EUGRSUZ_E00144 [Eucalyptus grandis]